MWGSRKVTSDPSRFEGEGISFRAKLIGIEDVKESRGDQMCQEAITKLKTAIRIAGGHKRKIIININLEGIKITDAISLVVLHSHAVPQISFISRDPTDSRAFGYICETEGLHKFFAIKTATAAEQVVLALKDLFQAVLEAKKKGSEPTKDSVDTEETNGSGDKENQQTSEIDQASPVTAAADADQVDQVLAATADTTSPQVNTQSVANLFDFEDQSGIVVQGSQKTRSLELEFLTDEVPSSATSSVASPLESVTPSATTATASADPWGLAAVDTSASKAPPTNTSALDDLAGIQTGFSSSFSLQTGFGTSTSFNPGLSASTDPFGNTAFSPFANQPPTSGVPGPQQQSFPAGFTLTNPFGSEFHQPFGMQGVPPRPGPAGAYSMFPGVIPHGVTTPLAMGAGHNPFAAQQHPGLQSGNPFGDSGPNKKDSAADSSVVSPEVLNARAKSPQDDFFSDLLDIKKPSPARAKSARDMFAQNATADKKSLNDLVGASPRASPVPPALLRPGTSPRASPIPPAMLKPGPSPRASPVPAALLKPGPSPRGSPVPMVQNIPASELLLAQNAPLLSPQASSVPILQDAPTQASLLDDFFGSSTEQHQVSEKSLFD